MTENTEAFELHYAVKEIFKMTSSSPSKHVETSAFGQRVELMLLNFQYLQCSDLDPIQPSAFPSQCRETESVESTA